MSARIVDGRFAVPASPVQEGLHGAVYKATDLRRDRPVALKLFKPSRIMDDRVLQDAWSNELNGYQTLGAHRNLVELIDWGRVDDGSPYLAFEWLVCDLLDHLGRVEIEGWDDYWPIARDVLGGLALVHRAGFVHRDLKPENVLVAEDGTCKVADFGTMRLVERLTLGRTMKDLHTPPYAPPEKQTTAPTLAYDVYSFSVLSLVCLSGKVPMNHHEALDVLAALDIPAVVEHLLRAGLAVDPAARPESACVVLAELDGLEQRRARQRQPELELFIHLQPRQQDLLASALGLSASGVAEYIRDDIAGLGAVAFDNRGVGDVPDLQVAGEVYLYRCQPHRSIPGALTILRAHRLPAQVLEYARAHWWRPKLRARFSSPTDADRARQALLAFLAEVAERDALRAEAEAKESGDRLFPEWRSLLRAKFAIEDERSSPIRYSGFVTRGSRVVFRVGELPELEPNEGRLVRVGRRKVLFGEVDAVENDELHLFVTRGHAADLPPRGVLEYDAEASKSKLRREQSALDRVCERRSVRPDLRDLLLDPGRAATPQPVDVQDFDERLDGVKRDAVRTALGSPDFMVVQGPPGTGKTTFIAELVARHLEQHPGSRVVLTSQTHIALDNALVRIQERAPDARLLRLGPLEKLTEEVEPLSSTPQLDAWRAEIVECGERFVREYARRLGIDVGDVDLKGLAEDLQRRRDQLHQLRSSIANRQAERRHVVAELQRLNELAPEVLSAAETIEKATRSTSAADVEQAARLLIDQALKLAAKLEAGAPLNDRLIELETSLATWRDEEREQAQHEQAIRDQLAAGLGTEERDPAALIAQAAIAGDTNDPRLTKVKAIASDWQERFGKSSEFTAALVLRSDVVAATCVGLAGIPGVDRIPFDLCIVDEGSKATATEVLVPLASSRKWVLVGDQRQLPPFVEHALDHPDLLRRFDINREQVHVTLFAALAERLPDVCTVQLTNQHRMHPTIGRLISECFYDGALTSADREVSPVVQMALGSPVLWFDTAGLPDRRERSAGTSVRNRREATTIAALLDRIDFVAAAQGQKLDVAVLTGYDAQRREVLDVITPRELERTSLHVRVATVDAYQGQEADIAIFSVTRSNTNGELGFLRSEERVNVALSRARDGLVIVGDSDFISEVSGRTHPLARVLQHIRSNDGCVIERVEP